MFPFGETVDISVVYKITLATLFLEMFTPVFEHTNSGLQLNYSTNEGIDNTLQFWNKHTNSANLDGVIHRDVSMNLLCPGS